MSRFKPFPLGIIHPIFVLGFLCLWLFLISDTNPSTLYQENWPIVITMLVGSFIAGSTCAGGGAVAFPVMTLLLGFSTIIARDFSLFIQSVGMISASLLILSRRIEVDYKILTPSILIASTSAVLGLMISSFLEAKLVKIFYLSLGLSFSFVFLYIELRLNKVKNQPADSTGPGNKNVHFIVCIVGGFISGIVGSGIDLLLFAYLILMKRQNIKIATPTSVIVMASVSLIVSSFRLTLLSDDLSTGVYSLWLAASPVVILGAPLGAFFAKKVPSAVLTGFIVTALSLQYCFGIFTVSLNYTLGIVSFGTIVFSLYAFNKLRSKSVKGSIAHIPIKSNESKEDKLLAS